MQHFLAITMHFLLSSKRFQMRSTPAGHASCLKMLFLKKLHYSPSKIWPLYNVGSVLQRLFSTAGDSISDAEAVQYCGG